MRFVILLLHKLHLLKVSQWIAFKCTVLVHKCLHGSALSYLIYELSQWQTSRHISNCIPHYLHR